MSSDARLQELQQDLAVMASAAARRRQTISKKLLCSANGPRLVTCLHQCSGKIMHWVLKKPQGTTLQE
jgi:hypothetical protein